MNDLTTTSGVGDALYGLYHRCWDACQDPDDPYGRKPTHRCWEITEYPIVKVTERRIFFREERGGPGYDRNYSIDRAKFDIPGCEQKKPAYHPRLRELLYLTPDIPTFVEQEARVQARVQAADDARRSIPELRRAMADAHPDRGGDRDTFMAARRRYLAAKGGAA